MCVVCAWQIRQASIFTFQIRQIVVRADLQKRYVGYVHHFEVVFTIVVNDWGVVGLLFGSGVIGRLKSARDELLEREKEEERVAANLHIMEIQCCEPACFSILEPWLSRGFSPKDTQLLIHAAPSYSVPGDSHRLQHLIMRIQSQDEENLMNVRSGG